MSKWRLTTIGKEAELLTGYPFKSSQYTDYEEDYLLLRGDNIGQGFIRWDNAKRWSKERVEGLDEYFLREGDVILAMDRPWIEAGLKFSNILKEDLPSLLVQRVSCLRAKGELSQVFLRYIIQGYEFTQYVIKTQTGTAVPHISSTQIKNFEFLAPPLDEQEGIAKILDALDRKIDNLRKQNETLEAIAQTLFKHWFVDFEFPNADGKPYKSSGGAMEPSELGDIPAVWRVGKLNELIQVNPRETIRKGSNVKYVDMKSLSTSSMEITDYIFREFTSGSKFRNRDTLLARITPCLENGKTAFVNILDSNEVAYGSTEFIVMRSKGYCCPEYVYCLSRSEYFRDYVIKNMTGSSGRQRVPNDQVEDYEIAIPELAVVQSFHSVCKSLFLKIESNQKQIQILAQTRDVLLPKLMSGKLRITT